MVSLTINSDTIGSLDQGGVCGLTSNNIQHCERLIRTTITLTDLQPVQ